MLTMPKYFPKACISVNRLRPRKANFPSNKWIMDSGAFTELSRFGHYRQGVEKYHSLITRWHSLKSDTLLAVVSQDYMCEPVILRKTGLTVADHQRLTIERYVALRALFSTPYLLPVLQGFAPTEYVAHLRQYGSLLQEGAWVGVGSVCKRNADPQAVVDVLSAILSERPDLRLHGFGLKMIALMDKRVLRRLYSSDSMAWSFDARYRGKNRNGLLEAITYYRRVQRLLHEGRQS